MGELSAARPCHFIPREAVHCIGAKRAFGVIVDVIEKRKISFPAENRTQNPRSSSSQPSRECSRNIRK
jgi:hypothetical protein